MRLDGNAALAFEVHRIEKLVLFIALVNGARCLEQSIGERRLPMIDMRDDAEVSGQLDRHKAVHYASVRMMGQSGRVPSPCSCSCSICASHSEAATEELPSSPRCDQITPCRSSLSARKPANRFRMIWSRKPHRHSQPERRKKIRPEPRSSRPSFWRSPPSSSAWLCSR